VQSVLALTVLVVQELAQWYATPDGHVLGITFGDVFGVADEWRKYLTEQHATGSWLRVHVVISHLV
jgi:hypothetical protein